jgi:hypothetical protein
MDLDEILLETKNNMKKTTIGILAEMELLTVDKNLTHRNKYELKKEF